MNTLRKTMRSGASPVVVTGASGFIALHLVRKLLDEGCRVRGTLRDLERGPALRRALGATAEREGRLEFVEADLLNDQGWQRAMAGACCLFHVASPIPSRPEKDQKALLGPARDGTLRALRAAEHAGLGRVVLTSSISAVLSGHARHGSRKYSEDDWSLETPQTPAYDLSKTLAERASWEFVRALPAERRFELVALNPGFVLGPVLDADCGTSNLAIQKLLSGQIPAIPRLGFAIADVRDVVELHWQAMITPEARGERFCCANEHWWLMDIAELLATHGYKVSTRRAPDWLFRALALFDAQVRVALPELARRSDVNCSKATRMLGWAPRTVSETILDTAKSLSAA
jgi:nucleoside-diphosphate-sugar epimerase